MKRRCRLSAAALAAVSFVMCVVLAGCGERGGRGELLSGAYNIEIDIKDYGVIKAELDADTAPVTVTNFVKLVNEGFYDGCTFHRIIPGFMIQGGAPSDGTAGTVIEAIKGEFAENGVENNISHTRGVLSMARTDDMNSATTQFFITHADSKYLDGKYAAFGHVTEGIEVVDAICSTVKPIDNDGTVMKEEQPVINSIRVVE